MAAAGIARHLEDLLDEVAEPIGIGEGVGEEAPAALRVRAAAQHGLEGHPDAGQRRLQLVRDRGDEVLVLPLPLALAPQGNPEQDDRAYHRRQEQRSLRHHDDDAPAVAAQLVVPLGEVRRHREAVERRGQRDPRHRRRPRLGVDQPEAGVGDREPSARALWIEERDGGQPAPQRPHERRPVVLGAPSAGGIGRGLDDTHLGERVGGSGYDATRQLDDADHRGVQARGDLERRHLRPREDQPALELELLPVLPQ